MREKFKEYLDSTVEHPFEYTLFFLFWNSVCSFFMLPGLSIPILAVHVIGQTAWIWAVLLWLRWYFNRK